MIDMRHKPLFLPQVSMPYEIALAKLRDSDVNYNLVKVPPYSLNPMQGITFSNDVSGVELSDLNPIWISDDMYVLDGHHRYVKSLMNGLPIMAVKIKLNNKDSCRILNKIQDIYEYEQALELEEGHVHQSNINLENDMDSDGSSRMNFLTDLDESNSNADDGESSKNPQKIIAYRREPINEKSVVGNFFTLKPVDGFDAYEIEFDNLLDTNEIGLTYRTDQNPVEILAKAWFPNINFEKISESNNINVLNLKNKSIAERAVAMGYDGIKYGDKLIQGLK